MISTRVAKSMPTSYQAPDCGLKSNHFKVSSGATYLKTAIETEVADNQKRALDDGERVLLEAMQQNKQDEQPGRVVLTSAGSTSSAATSTAPTTALARAEKLAPGLRQGDRRLPPERAGSRSSRAGTGSRSRRTSIQRWCCIARPA